MRFPHLLPVCIVITSLFLACKPRNSSQLREITNEDLDNILAQIEGKGFGFGFVKSYRPKGFAKRITAMATDRGKPSYDRINNKPVWVGGESVLVLTDADGNIAVRDLAMQKDLIEVNIDDLIKDFTVTPSPESSEKLTAVDVWRAGSSGADSSLLSIVVGSVSGKVAKLVFNMKSKEFDDAKVMEQSHSRIVHSVDLAFDGKMFASSSADGSIHYWKSTNPISLEVKFGSFTPKLVNKNTDSAKGPSELTAVEVVEVLPDHSILAARGANLEYWSSGLDQAIYPFEKTIVEDNERFDARTMRYQNQAAWITSIDSTIRQEAGTRFLEILVATGDEAGIVKSFRRRIPPPQSNAERQVKSALRDQIEDSIIVSQMQPLTTKASAERVGGVRFSSDGRFLITGGLGLPLNQSFLPSKTTEGLLRLWQVHDTDSSTSQMSLKELRRLYVPTASSGIRAVSGANAPQSIYFMDESGNNAIHHWQIAAMDRPLTLTRTPTSHASFDPTGQILVSTHDRGQQSEVNVWSISSSSLKRGELPKPLVSQSTWADNFPVARVTDLVSYQTNRGPAFAFAHCDGRVTITKAAATVGESLEPMYESAQLHSSSNPEASSCEESGLSLVTTSDFLLFHTYKTPQPPNSTNWPYVTAAYELQTGAPVFFWRWNKSLNGLSDLESQINKTDFEEIKTKLPDSFTSKNQLWPKIWKFPTDKTSKLGLVTMTGPTLPKPERVDLGDFPVPVEEITSDEAKTAREEWKKQQEQLDAHYAEELKNYQSGTNEKLHRVALDNGTLYANANLQNELNPGTPIEQEINAAAVSHDLLWTFAASQTGGIAAIYTLDSRFRYRLPLLKHPSANQVTNDLDVAPNQLLAVAHNQGLELWWAGQDYRYLYEK